jgi:hypothetical protein
MKPPALALASLSFFARWASGRVKSVPSGLLVGLIVPVGCDSRVLMTLHAHSAYPDNFRVIAWRIIGKRFSGVATGVLGPSSLPQD